MNLETIKKQDNSWWLKHLEDTTVFDVKLIKEQFDWLILQAEKVERYEDSLKLIHRNATSGHVKGIVKRTLRENDLN